MLYMFSVNVVWLIMMGPLNPFIFSTMPLLKNISNQRVSICMPASLTTVGNETRSSVSVKPKLWNKQPVIVKEGSWVVFYATKLVILTCYKESSTVKGYCCLYTIKPLQNLESLNVLSVM